MKAITIRQPYASLIVAGVKRVENRSWQTHYRGRLAIHAAARPPDEDVDVLHDDVVPEVTILGAILGSVVLLDCVRVEDLPPDLRQDPHAQGPWCWILADPRPLATPSPCRGRQGLWSTELPHDRTTVVNVRAAPRGLYLYVGRAMPRHKKPAIRAGSIWGNPYKDGPAKVILKKYREHVLGTPALRSQLHTLRGKVLGCWCCTWDGTSQPAPACHAVVLAQLADSPLGEPTLCSCSPTPR